MKYNRIQTSLLICFLSKIVKIMKEEDIPEIPTGKKDKVEDDDEDIPEINIQTLQIEDKVSSYPEFLSFSPLISRYKKTDMRKQSPNSNHPMFSKVEPMTSQFATINIIRPHVFGCLVTTKTNNLLSQRKVSEIDFFRNRFLDFFRNCFLFCKKNYFSKINS